MCSLHVVSPTLAVTMEDWHSAAREGAHHSKNIQELDYVPIVQELQGFVFSKDIGRYARLWLTQENAFHGHLLA